MTTTPAPARPAEPAIAFPDWLTVGASVIELVTGDYGRSVSGTRTITTVTRTTVTTDSPAEAQRTWHLTDLSTLDPWAHLQPGPPYLRRVRFRGNSATVRNVRYLLPVGHPKLTAHQETR